MGLLDEIEARVARSLSQGYCAEEELRGAEKTRELASKAVCEALEVGRDSPVLVQEDDERASIEVVHPFGCFAVGKMASPSFLPSFGELRTLYRPLLLVSRERVEWTEGRLQAMLEYAVSLARPLVLFAPELSDNVVDTFIFNNGSVRPPLT